MDKYLGRVSGPLLDRIDLHVEVPAVPFGDLAATADGTSSASMRAEVLRARAVQRGRFSDSLTTNGRMGPRQVRQHARPDADGQALLKAAMDDLGLSARAHDRILRVARTVADLAGRERVEAGDVAEAVGYRSLDRKLWVR